MKKSALSGALVVILIASSFLVSRHFRAPPPKEHESPSARDIPSLASDSSVVESVTTPGPDPAPGDGPQDPTREEAEEDVVVDYGRPVTWSPAEFEERTEFLNAALAKLPPGENFSSGVIPWLESTLHAEHLPEPVEGWMFDKMVFNTWSKSSIDGAQKEWTALLDLDEESQRRLGELLLYYGTEYKAFRVQASKGAGLTSKNFGTVDVRVLQDVLDVRRRRANDLYFQFTKELRRTLRPEEFQRYTDLMDLFNLKH